MTTRFEDACESAVAQSLLRSTRFVLAERESELLELKGPCSNNECPLHYAHRGPCDRKVE